MSGDYGHKFVHGPMVILSSIKPITLPDIAKSWTMWNPVTDDILPVGGPQ